MESTNVPQLRRKAIVCMVGSAQSFPRSFVSRHALKAGCEALALLVASALVLLSFKKESFKKTASPQLMSKLVTVPDKKFELVVFPSVLRIQHSYPIIPQLPDNRSFSIYTLTCTVNFARSEIVNQKIFQHALDPRPILQTCTAHPCRPTIISHEHYHISSRSGQRGNLAIRP